MVVGDRTSGRNSMVMGCVLCFFLFVLCSVRVKVLWCFMSVFFVRLYFKWYIFFCNLCYLSAVVVFRFFLYFSFVTNVITVLWCVSGLAWILWRADS